MTDKLFAGEVGEGCDAHAPGFGAAVVLVNDMQVSLENTGTVRQLARIGVDLVRVALRRTMSSI